MSANREHHDDIAPTGAEASAAPGDAKGARTDAGRRRLLQVGVGAAPVILTLTSKPAFAQVLDRSAIESMSTCMSLDVGGCGDESSASITTLKSFYQPTPSKQDLAAMEEGSTLSTSTDPGNLTTLASTETTDTTSTTTTTTTSTSTSTSTSTDYLDAYSGPVFSSIFGTTWGPQTGRGKWKGDERFGDILWMDESRDPQNFGKLLVAAYLNASAGTYTLNLTQVVTMGQRALAGLPYYLSEGSTVSWDQAQVIKYLTNTIKI